MYHSTRGEPSRSVGTSRTAVDKARLPESVPILPICLVNNVDVTSAEAVNGFPGTSARNVLFLSFIIFSDLCRISSRDHELSSLCLCMRCSKTYRRAGPKKGLLVPKTALLVSIRLSQELHLPQASKSKRYPQHRDTFRPKSHPRDSLRSSL
jgi:hypothetical protein